MAGLDQLLPFILVAGLYWLLIWKPGNDERLAHEALLASLKKDDWIVTRSGIHGRIVKVNDDTVVLEIDSGTKITLDKPSVDRCVVDDRKKA